jgi:outer membrane protein assembly factor BamE (lipoprotein component of BamABCDE complex)
MKKKIIIPILFILVLILTSCASDYMGRSSTDSSFMCIVDKYSPGFVERYLNTENAKRLQIGMTKEEVYKLMGEPLLYEQYSEPNIWFYYTDWDWADCAKTKTECTPLVFENDKLVGFGRVFYGNYSHRDWLFDQKDYLGKHKIED